MHGSLHYDYQAPADCEIREITACGLKAYDVIVADGRIPLHITEVRPMVAGFVTAAYICTAGVGFRTFAAGQRLEVLRSLMTEAH